MKKALSGLKSKESQAEREARAKEHKKALREQEASQKAQIELCKQKGREGPSVFEAYDKKTVSKGTNLEKMKAMRKFMDIMQDNEAAFS